MRADEMRRLEGAEWRRVMHYPLANEKRRLQQKVTGIRRAE
jgi:hypothetical protein